MNYYFTDEEIQSLIAEEKPFGGLIDEMMNFKESDGHKRSSVEIVRADNSLYVIKLRQNLNNVNDFSAILAFQERGFNKDFKIRRYNGKSHEYSNKLEGDKFYAFHIHMATQRYQDVGRKEESFAEATDRYSDLRGALKCLLKDCNVITKLNPQTSLFSE
ncbi:MAG: hypothetical protein L6422_04375 [Candidatus Marinimicrobia bacterium]|nr:hypothetical protein [bacterium]MCG2715513.1 hypothetical protein [Candidatus Neomarinimicrobiota bacterium]